MAICSRCGNYAIDGTAVCPVCGTPFPPVQQMAPPPVPGAMPQGPAMQSGVEVIMQNPTIQSMGSMVSGNAAQVVKQTVQQVANNAGLGSMPNIPNIPSVDAIGTMATGGLKQAATQAVQQFTGGIDLMATEAQGEIVLSSWKMPTSASSVVQMGASAVQKATKGKYAWMWFLIPVFTILAWVISQLAK